MEFVVYLIIFLLFFIFLRCILFENKAKAIQVKKPKLSKNYKLKNKETNQFKDIYGLKNLEVLFLDSIISKLKTFDDLVFQEKTWKILPNKLMFYVENSNLKVNQKFYSMLLNQFNNISFTSNLNFAKSRYCENKKNQVYFKINNISISNLITFKQKTYIILNIYVFIVLKVNMDRNFLEIKLINKTKEKACFEFMLKLNKMDYYSISRLNNQIILKGEIFKEEYYIYCDEQTEIQTNGIFIFIKTFSAQQIIIKRQTTKNNHELKYLTATDSIENMYYSYMNLNFLNLKTNFIDIFLMNLGIEINSKFIKVNKIKHNQDFWIKFDGYHFNFVKDCDDANICFVVNGKKLSGLNKLNLNLIQNKNLTIIY